MARCRVALGCVVVLTLAGGCGSSPSPPSPPGPPDEVRLDWVEMTLPVPPGGPGRLVLRAAAGCDGRWYVVGGVLDPAGNSRPAAWTSPDGQTWTALRITPHTFYGNQNTLYTAACRGGQLAAVGAKSGGVHGNPRVSSWHLRPDGTLDEVIAAFEQYGGPNAVATASITGGPAGWLIAGTRTSGAAVWVSPDSTEFTLVEGAPGLATDAQWVTSAADAAASGGRWVVVGSGMHPGQVGREPLAWTSVDGRRWDRVEVPGDDTYEELHRVVAVDDGVLAAGVHGLTFGTWRGDPSGWRTAGRFGSTAGDRVPVLAGLAAAGGAVFAVTASGDAFALWTSNDRGTTWRPALMPTVAQPGAEHATAVAILGQKILLLVDDGQTARLWSASLKTAD